MLGKPMYHWGNYVTFRVTAEEKVGKIDVVDAYGTFEQAEEPSYDIFVEKENCIYKHIRESAVTRIKKLSYKNGSRHTGLAAPPHRNNHYLGRNGKTVKSPMHLFLASDFFISCKMRFC
jgi:hypothetical protein